MMKYRMYVDEVGNSDLRASMNPIHRYLSLTGLIVEIDYVQRVLYPTLEAFKAMYFESHPDEPVILHRKELVNKRPPFGRLRDPEVESAFNRELLSLLSQLDFRVVTAVIDKKQHLEQFSNWRFDPYHYCMSVLVERFVMWLEEHDNVGDVMAESRGGGEDTRLKEAFRELYVQGTQYVANEVIQARLTSGQLKLKSKSNNIAGLQIADLLAHPSQAEMVAAREGRQVADNFGTRICAILHDGKYLRDWDGNADGWGREWLP